MAGVRAEAQSTPATLTPSSGTLSTSQTFTWSNGVGVTEYSLFVGTTGFGSTNLLNSNETTATSVKISIPPNGATVYAKFCQLINGAWQYSYYQFTEPSLSPATLSPSSGTLSTSQQFTWSNGVGPTAYQLLVGTTGVGSSNVYSSGSTTATSATVSIQPDDATVYVRLMQLINNAWQSTDYSFTEPSASPAALSPSSGTVSTSQLFTWNNGAGPTSYQLLVGTTGVGSSNLFNSGSTTGTSATVSIPSDGVTIFVRLMQLINNAWQSTNYTFTEPGTLVPATLAPSSGTLAASQTFTWSNGVGPAEYSLFVGTTGFGSTNLLNCNETTVTSVKISIPSNGGTVYARFYQLIDGVWRYTDYEFTEPGVPTLAVSATSVNFGTVAVGGTGTGSVTLTSSGAAPVVVSAGSVSGTGYTISGVSFPLTLSPGQTATVTVSFAPTAAGLISGSMALTSNSSTGTTSTISLSGTGQPVVSSFTGTSTSMTGAGTDTCTVTLNAAAGTGGQVVNVSSNNTAVVVPTSVTVAAGATSANFTATISAVSTAQNVTLTATSGGGTQSYWISLGAAVPTLALQSTSVPFGDVTDGSPAYQSVTLTSSGTGTVTVSAGSVSGTGYSISGVSFPLTLNSGQNATLEIEFDPTTTGVSDGTVTLTSNSSTGTTSTISLSGTGVAPSSSYEVSLTWDAPAESSDPVAGYNVYRAISGSSTYELLSSLIDAATSYTDSSVANNTSYTYYVESVDAEGNESGPSNTFTISVP